jgi:hypothetical protein
LRMLYCHVISAFREKGGIALAGFVLAFSCVQVLLAFSFFVFHSRAVSPMGYFHWGKVFLSEGSDMFQRFS